MSLERKVRSRRGDYRRADVWFNESLALLPDAPAVLFARGRNSLRIGDLSAALTSFAAARDKAPDGLTSAYLGYCESRLGQHDSALVHHEEARTLGYAPATVFNNLGYSRLCKAKYPEARKALDQALTLDPQFREHRHGDEPLGSRPRGRPEPAGRGGMPNVSVERQTPGPLLVRRRCRQQHWSEPLCAPDPRPESGRALGYNAESVTWADGNLERERVKPDIGEHEEGLEVRRTCCPR